MSRTYFRLLSENDMNYAKALQHAAAVIDFLGASASAGYMRAPPVTEAWEPKVRVEPLDVAREQPPHA